MPTPNFFPNFTPIGDADVEQELVSAGEVPADHGQDVLPFDFLGGRRFEILAYRLKAAVAAGAPTTATLVQSSADRGRDVLLYSNGQLVEIIQCKNQSQKVTRPQVLHELAKLGLHAQKNPNILGSGPVRYEIWCTSDFFEPAAHLIDTWPTDWTEASVRPAFDDVVSSYADFTASKWDDVATFLLTEFPRIVVPFKRTGLDISDATRRAPAVYRQFFRGAVVMEADQVEQKLRDILAEGGLRQVSSEDMRHVIDRMGQFPEEARLYLGYGYSLGLTPQQLALLSGPELQEFATNCLNAGIGNLRILLNAIVRQINPRILRHMANVTIGNANFGYVLTQVLTLRVLARFSQTLIVMSQAPVPADILSLGLEQLVEKQIGLVWDEMQKIVASHEERLSKGPDEVLRTKIAEFALVGFSSKDEFERLLRSDFQRNGPMVKALDSEIQALIPSELVVISDSRLAFTDRRLIQRMLESFNRLEEARESTDGVKTTAGGGHDRSLMPTSGRPRLDRVTWAKVPYKAKALHRGFHAALVFSGFNFSSACTWAVRKIGEAGPPSGSADYWWRQANLYRPNHLEVSTNDDEFETPLGYSSNEFCIKNANGELSEWRRFEYSLDLDKLTSILDENERRGVELLSANLFAAAVEPLRKAWSYSSHLLKKDDPRLSRIEKAWNSAIDGAALARLRFRTGDRVRVRSGPFNGRTGVIEELYLRSVQAYFVKLEDGQTGFLADSDVDAIA